MAPWPTLDVEDSALSLSLTVGSSSKPFIKTFSPKVDAVSANVIG